MTTRKQKPERKSIRLKQPPASERPTFGKRPTKAEKEGRISQVMTMLLSGVRRIEICEFALKTWGITFGQSDRYIAEATQWIRDNASKTREEQLVEHIGRMDTVFRSAFGAGDYHAAIKAQQDKAKLIALYPDPKLKVEGWQDEVIHLLKEGKVSANDVFAELGDTDETRRLVVAAGASAVAGGTVEGQGAQSPTDDAPGLDATVQTSSGAGSPV